MIRFSLSVISRMGNYEKLEAWQLSMSIAEHSLRLADSLRGPSRFALGDQIRRCSISIPSNLAEGVGRGTPRDFARFVRFARGSLYELQTQLLLGERSGSLPEGIGDIQPSLRQLRAMLYSLITTLDNS